MSTRTIARPESRWYGALAAVPDPGRSADERRRYLHRDIAALPDSELAREAAIVRLALCRQRDPWLTERAERLRAEGCRRGRPTDRRWVT
jgi:hypothetical protein